MEGPDVLVHWKPRSRWTLELAGQKKDANPFKSSRLRQDLLMSDLRGRVVPVGTPASTGAFVAGAGLAGAARNAGGDVARCQPETSARWSSPEKCCGAQ